MFSAGSFTKGKNKKSNRFGISFLFRVTNKTQERIFGTLLPSDLACDNSKTHPGRFAASDFHWQLWTVSSSEGGRVAVAAVKKRLSAKGFNFIELSDVECWPAGC